MRRKLVEDDRVADEWKENLRISAGFGVLLAVSYVMLAARKSGAEEFREIACNLSAISSDLMEVQLVLLGTVVAIFSITIQSVPLPVLWGPLLAPWFREVLTVGMQLNTRQLVTQITSGVSIFVALLSVVPILWRAKYSDTGCVGGRVGDPVLAVVVGTCCCVISCSITSLKPTWKSARPVVLTVLSERFLASSYWITRLESELRTRRTRRAYPKTLIILSCGIVCVGLIAVVSTRVCSSASGHYGESFAYLTIAAISVVVLILLELDLAISHIRFDATLPILTQLFRIVTWALLLSAVVVWICIFSVTIYEGSHLRRDLIVGLTGGLIEGALIVLLVAVRSITRSVIRDNTPRIDGLFLFLRSVILRLMLWSVRRRAQRDERVIRESIHQGEVWGYYGVDARNDDAYSRMLLKTVIETSNSWSSNPSWDLRGAQLRLIDTYSMSFFSRPRQL